MGMWRARSWLSGHSGRPSIPVSDTKPIRFGSLSRQAQHQRCCAKHWEPELTPPYRMLSPDVSQGKRQLLGRRQAARLRSPVAVKNQSRRPLIFAWKKAVSAVGRKTAAHATDNSAASGKKSRLWSRSSPLKRFDTFSPRDKSFPRDKQLRFRMHQSLLCSLEVVG